MKKILLIVVLAVFAWTGVQAQVVNPSVPVAAPAQPSKEYVETLKKFMEVSGAMEVFKNMIPQMFAMLKQQVPNVPAEVWTQMEKDVTPANLMDDIVTAFAPEYEKLLSKADLEELIKFYETPVGKKLAATQPMIMQGTTQVSQQIGMQVMQQVQKTLQEKGYIPTQQPGM